MTSERPQEQYDREIEEFGWQLANWLQSRFGRKKTENIFSDELTIDASGKNRRYDIYLRWKPAGDWPEDTLVIARLFFKEKHQRKGYGTEFLRFLTEEAEQFGIRNIAIESYNDNSLAFAKKFGFRHFLKSELSEGEWVKSLKLNAHTLQSNIEIYEMRKKKKQIKDNAKHLKRAIKELKAIKL